MVHIFKDKSKLKLGGCTNFELEIKGQCLGSKPIGTKHHDTLDVAGSQSVAYTPLGNKPSEHIALRQTCWSHQCDMQLPPLSTVLLTGLCKGNLSQEADSRQTISITFTATTTPACDHFKFCLCESLFLHRYTWTLYTAILLTEVFDLSVFFLKNF